MRQNSISPFHLPQRSTQGIHAPISAFEKPRQRPYGTEILWYYAAVDEGLRLPRLSRHLNDISFCSLPVGMKVVMRFDAYIRELEASLSMRSSSSRRNHAKNSLVCTKPKKNEWTPSYLTYFGLVASICVAICSPTDPMQRLYFVLLLNNRLMYEGLLQNDAF